MYAVIRNRKMLCRHGYKIAINITWVDQLLLKVIPIFHFQIVKNVWLSVNLRVDSFYFHSTAGDSMYLAQNQISDWYCVIVKQLSYCIELLPRSQGWAHYGNTVYHFDTWRQYGSRCHAYQLPIYGQMEGVNDDVPLMVETPNLGQIVTFLLTDWNQRHKHST